MKTIKQIFFSLVLISSATLVAKDGCCVSNAVKETGKGVEKTLEGVADIVTAPVRGIADASEKKECSKEKRGKQNKKKKEKKECRYSKTTNRTEEMREESNSDLPNS